MLEMLRTGLAVLDTTVLGLPDLKRTVAVQPIGTIFVPVEEVLLCPEGRVKDTHVTSG